MPITPSPGNWNIGPINLPDWGISEKLFGPAWGNTSKASANTGLVNDPVVQQRLETSQQSPALPVPNQINYALTGNVGQTPTFGQVAGATTSQSSGGSSGPDLSNPVKQTDYARSQGYDSWQQYLDAQNAVSNRENEMRNTINTGYDSLLNNYQNLIPFYEGQQNTQLQSAQDIYNQIAQGLGQTKDTAMDKLGIARNQVQANVGNSVKDLQQNLMGVVRNTGMQLGAMGAGDTSASNVMAPYAYTKLAGQEYGKIQRQGNDQQFQIQTQERDTENQYNQMVNQANIEKEQQLQGIRDQFGSVIAQIRNQMANVPAEKAQALAGLQQNLLQQAQSRLSQIEGYYMNLQGEMQNWAQNRMAQLNDAKMQLSQSANFNPQDIVWQELQARNMVNQTPSTGAYWNPEMMKKRREELGY